MLRKRNYKIDIILFRRASNYIKDVSIEAGVLTVILCLVFLFLLGSIFRVLSNAKNNYEIFNIEKDSLNELEAKNGDLKKELEYVSSDEYKRLFLRDTKGLSASNEELYTLREDPNYFEEEKTYLDLKEKKNFSDWWIGLLN